MSDFTKADRDIDKLDDDFKFKVKLFLMDNRIKELGVFVTEAYRSQERQNWLYASGRTRKGGLLTWTLSSNHGRGLAIDIAFHGKDLYPKDMKIWREVYDIARFFGIKSLYDTFGVDKPHLENDRSRPPQIYINYFKNMGKITEAQLDALIALNSATYHITDDQELQERLHKMNDYLRKLKK